MTNLVWMTSFRGSGGNAAPPFALGPRFVEIAATPATSASQEEEADMTVRITRPRAEPRNGSIRTRTRLGFRIALLPLVFALFVCFALLGCSRDDTDPTRLDQSLEAALDIQDGFERAERLIELLRSTVEGDRADLSSRVRNRYRPIDPLDHLLLVKAWAALDPAAATKWARAGAPNNIHGAAVEVAVRQWAALDPVAVAAELPVGEPDVARPLVAGWFDSGKPGLTDFVLSQGSLQEGQLLIAAYLRELIAREGPAAATDWVASVRGADGLILAVRRHAGKELATSHPDAAIAFCNQYCSGPQGTAVRIFVARRLGEIGQGRKAVRWLAESDEADPKEKGQAIRAAYLGWLGDDRKSALTWAETSSSEYESEPWFQHVIGLVVSATSWDHPERALPWADRLKDPERKNLALITIARRWRNHDPVAAEAWLMASPLTEESRRVARQYPKNYPRRPEPPLPFINGGQ